MSGIIPGAGFGLRPVIPAAIRLADNSGMPYCPQCTTEYRAGFARCADCGVDLLPEKPPRPPASHDHHAAAPGVPAPTSTLFPAAPVAPPPVEGEEAGEGFVRVGDRAWVYSATSGAEAWFLRALYRARGLAAQIEFMGPAHPVPYRVLVPLDDGHRALQALDELLGTWECPRCGELGPAPSEDFPLCLACSLPPS